MKLSFAFSLIVASAITSSAAEVAEFGQHSLRSASADSDRSDLSSSARRRFQVLSIDDLWEQQHVQLSLLPYVDLANNEYKLTGDVPTEEGSLRLVFKFKGSDKGDMTLADLLGGWTEEKDVGVSWTVGYHEVGGQDGGYPDLVELSHALKYTLKDPGKALVGRCRSASRFSSSKIFVFLSCESNLRDSEGRCTHGDDCRRKGVRR